MQCKSLLKPGVIIFASVIFAGILYMWGYLTHSRRYFPYNLISNEHKRKKKDNEDISYYFQQVDAYSLITLNRDNVDSIKRFINHVIFNQHYLPADLPVSVKKISDTRYDTRNLESIYQLEIAVGQKYRSFAYFFNPKNPKKEVVFYHQGHEGDFIAGKKTIDYFIERGYPVYAFAMPFLFKNNFVNENVVDSVPFRDRIRYLPGGWGHGWIKFQDNPLSFFLLPVISTVNYVKSINPDAQIFMLGISGGGWTTHMAGAIDPRIKKSFGVAGSYPLYISMNDPEVSAYGDYEQTYEPLFKAIDYLDLYVLSCSENRNHYQILNLNDPCCFKKGLGYLYEDGVNKKNREMSFGRFEVFIDSSNTQHSISQISLDYIHRAISQPQIGQSSP